MKKDIETTYGINKWKNKLVVFMQNDITHHVSRIKLSKNNLPANASAILLLIRIYYIAVETEKSNNKKNPDFLSQFWQDYYTLVQYCRHIASATKTG